MYEKKLQNKFYNASHVVKCNYNVISLFHLFICCIQLVCSFFLQALGKEKYFESQQLIIVFYGTVITIYILASCFFILRRIDFFMLFIGISYFFMFGQQLLFVLKLNPPGMKLISGVLSDKALFETGFLVINSFIIIFMGYLFVLPKRLPHILFPKTLAEQIQKKKLMASGIIVFCVTLMPTLYTLLNNIWLNFSAGYGERMINSTYRKSGLSNLPGVLSGYMIPALLAMYVAKEQRQKWPTLFLCVYIILYLLSGSRIHAFILIVTVFFIHISIHTSLKWKSLIRQIVIIAIAFIGFGLVSQLRAGIQINSDNLITKTISEAGYTFCTTATVVDNCPNKVPFLKGKSYISGIAYILPNAVTGNYFGRIAGVDETFQDYLTPWGGIGSSFIAEAYYNFGHFSYVLIFFYGIFLGAICAALEKNIINGNYRKIYLYTGIFSIIIFYVRSDTRTFFRNFLWFYVPIYILSYCITEKESTSVLKLKTKKHQQKGFTL